jgi:putative ABC transport system permease protein
MRLRDILSLSFRTVRSNKLRTTITVAIIAFGIMALVGINTAIDAMKQKFTESFASMGANGFTIRYNDVQIFGHRRQPSAKEKRGYKKEKVSNTKIPISKDQAELFKKNYHFPSKVSISIRGGDGNIVGSGSSKTNPTVLVIGGDENYADLNGYTLDAGRSLNDLDVQSGRNVCILGSDLVKKFFNGNPDKAIERIVKINNMPYRVIGTMESRGSSIGRSFDNVAITSYNNVRRFFLNDPVSPFNPTPTFVIQVKIKDVKQMDLAIRAIL